MTPQESAEFLPRLVALAELYHAPMSESTQSLYFSALEDLPLDDVIRAMNAALKACEFMPRPAKLRELCAGSFEDRAELAWLEYKDLARSIGAYGSPIMDALLADTLIAVFGSWEHACWDELSPEMWAAKRKEFGRVYHAPSTRRTSADREKLTGFCERENQKKEALIALASVTVNALTEHASDEPVTTEPMQALGDIAKTTKVESALAQRPK